jgi:Fumarate reductase subunit D
VNKRSNEPFLWLLFSAGGVVAAMLLPAHLFLFGLAFPLGWLPSPGYDRLLALGGHLAARFYLLSSAIPLGASVPLHALRWSPDQAFERTDQSLLLWRSGPGNRSHGLPALENPIKVQGVGRRSEDVYCPR